MTWTADQIEYVLQPVTPAFYSLGPVYEGVEGGACVNEQWDEGALLDVTSLPPNASHTGGAVDYFWDLGRIYYYDAGGHVTRSWTLHYLHWLLPALAYAEAGVCYQFAPGVVVTWQTIWWDMPS